MATSRETAANIRGDIQQGKSGDKMPGFDPAAAPMETDSEAGGVSLDSETIRLSRSSQYNPDMPDRQGTDATAMRLFEPQRAERDAKRRSVTRIAGGIAIALVLIAFVIFLS